MGLISRVSSRTYRRAKMKELKAESLQTYHKELKTCIENLTGKRDELQKAILQEEMEKQRIQHDIHLLNAALLESQRHLTEYIQHRNDAQEALTEVESAHAAIKREAKQLMNRALASVQDPTATTPVVMLKNGDDDGDADAIISLINTNGI